MTAWWNALLPIQQIFAFAAIPATLILVLQTLLLLLGAVGHDGAEGGHDSGGDELDFDGHDAGFEGAGFDGHDAGFDASGFDGHDVGFEGAGFDGHDVGFDSSGFDGHDGDFDAGGSDADFDSGTDGGTGGVFGDHSHDHNHYDSGLRIFTVRAFVAFFSIFGWTGIVLTEKNAGINTIVAVIIAFLAGLAAMLGMAYFFKFAVKLQSSGNIDLRNCLGKTAAVYIPIPPNRTGKGKITVVIQDRFTEVDAVTDSDVTLKTGTEVIGVSVSSDNVICVAPMSGGLPSDAGKWSIDNKASDDFEEARISGKK